MSYWGGGFRYFWFSPLFGEDSHFDSYFSNGLIFILFGEDSRRDSYLSNGLKPPTFFFFWGGGGELKMFCSSETWCAQAKTRWAIFYLTPLLSLGRWFLGPKCAGIETTFQVDSGHYIIMMMMMMMMMLMMMMMRMRMMNNNNDEWWWWWWWWWGWWLMTNLLTKCFIDVTLSKDFNLFTHDTIWSIKYKSPYSSPLFTT